MTTKGKMLGVALMLPGICALTIVLIVGLRDFPGATFYVLKVGGGIAILVTLFFAGIAKLVGDW